MYIYISLYLNILVYEFENKCSVVLQVHIYPHVIYLLCIHIHIYFETLYPRWFVDLQDAIFV